MFHIDIIKYVKNLIKKFKLNYITNKQINKLNYINYIYFL